MVGNAPYGSLGNAPYGSLGIAEEVKIRGVVAQTPGWAFATAQQVHYAKLIVAKFAAAGLGTAAGLAAVVNAIAESQLNPHAVNGDVAGLFQLAPWGGAPNCGAAGYGMSQSARKNARRSINRIIDVVKGNQLIALGGTCQDVGVRFRQRAAAGASIAELTGIFCNEIERPGAAHCTSRPGNARTLFGARADAPGHSLPQLGRVGGALIATPWYYWLGVALLAGGTFFWWRRRKRRRAEMGGSQIG